MRPLLNLALLGTAIVGARGRVTPGLCFELRLSTGGRYQKNLAHQLEAIGPLLAAGVRQQPALASHSHSAPSTVCGAAPLGFSSPDRFFASRDLAASDFF